MGNLLTLKGRFAEGLQIDKRLVQLRPNDRWPTTTWRAASPC